MRNDFIEHSFKGTSWKNHLYDRKEGTRYIYNSNKSSAPHNIADDVVDTPDFEGLAYELGKIKIVRMLRDFIDFPIWSPYPEDVTLISKGKEKIASLIRKDNKMAASAKTKKRK